MRKLDDVDDEEVFYRGTIIILKDVEKTSSGIFNKMYGMVSECGLPTKFLMVDLSRSMGACIVQDLKPNVKGHFGVNKQGIFYWAADHFKHFFTKEYGDECLSKLSEIVYVADLSDYFEQTDRDIIVN